jgi:hypothetical protein
MMDVSASVEPGTVEAYLDRKHETITVYLNNELTLHFCIAEALDLFEELKVVLSQARPDTEDYSDPERAARVRTGLQNMLEPASPTSTRTSHPNPQPTSIQQQKEEKL